MTQIPRIEGRTVFGESPAEYDRFRPRYPAWVYDVLVSRCGLKPNTATFEIGPGSGVATRELIRLGANPIVAIESDPRFAQYLSSALPSIEVVNTPFEDAGLPAGVFDLGVAATSMHWLEEASALRRISQLLRSGGYWACLWNVFGDSDREDLFHEATHEIMRPLGDSPSSGHREIPHALDHEARLSAIRGDGAFEDIQFTKEAWTLTLDTAGVTGLYGTYSQVARLPVNEKQRVLSQLGQITEEQFGGSVTRNMVTVLYTARRM